jgi:hypothetical protein
MALPGDTQERSDVRTDAVHDALDQLRSVAGLVGACLVEPASGQVIDSVIGDAGQPGAMGDTAVAVVAAGAGDIVEVVRLMTASLGDPDDVEDVIVTLGRHHHIVRALPEAGVDGLFVALTLDRSRTNLALARRQVRALDPVFGRPHAP